MGFFADAGNGISRREVNWVVSLEQAGRVRTAMTARSGRSFMESVSTDKLWISPVSWKIFFKFERKRDLRR